MIQQDSSAKHLKKKERKKKQYGHERHKNLSEDEKRRLAKYRAKIIKYAKIKRL